METLFNWELVSKMSGVSVDELKRQAERSPEYILGLDVSTSITGWALIPLDNSKISLGYLPLQNSFDLYEKAQKVREGLLRLREDFNVRAVYVEEDLQRFARGRSSSRTLSTLSRFNGVTCQIAYEVFGIKPVHINVNEARKSVGIKYNVKDKSKSTKEKVFEVVRKKIDYDWPTKTLKSGPRKGTVVLEPGCFDAADAWVIAAAGIRMNSRN